MSTDEGAAQADTVRHSASPTTNLGDGNMQAGSIRQCTCCMQCRQGFFTHISDKLHAVSD